MEVSRILAEIDAQISKLQQARALLAGNSTTASRRGPGRPKGTASAVKSVTKTSAKAPKKTAKRVLSVEARKRIADAQKRRWAKAKKSA